MSAADQHFQLAVAGHEAALRGDHPTALTKYREAMHVAVRSKAPEVFFRHYLEATLESLELMGALQDVLNYCDRAIEHYTAEPPAHDVARLDLATIHQRRGVVLLKMGDTKGARTALLQAQVVAEEAGAKLELARLVGGWLSRGLVIRNERLLAEQRRLNYFSVRAGAVDGARAGGMAPASRTH